MSPNEEKQLERLQAEKDAADLALSAAYVQVGDAQRALNLARKRRKKALEALLKAKESHVQTING